MRSDVLSGLICVQSVNKGNEKSTLVGNELRTADLLSGLICVQSVNKGNSCYICIFYKMKHSILIHINGLHKYEPHRQLKRFYRF